MSKSLFLYVARFRHEEAVACLYIERLSLKNFPPGPIATCWKRKIWKGEGREEKRKGIGGKERKKRGRGWTGNEKGKKDEKNL